MGFFSLARVGSNMTRRDIENINPDRHNRSQHQRTMGAEKYKKEFSHCFSDSPGSTIYIDYHFDSDDEGFGFRMADIKEDYGGELSAGTSCELHAVYGENALDFVSNLLANEIEMMFTLDDLICEIDSTPRGSKVARKLLKALKQYQDNREKEARHREKLMQEQARENARIISEWNESEPVKFLRSAGYTLPNSPDDLKYERERTISENKLRPGIDKAIGENNMRALKALVEIGRDDELLGVYAFQAAGKARNLDAVRELVAFYGHDGDMRKHYIWYNVTAISQPFKILFEEGFEEGAIFVLKKRPDIENRRTSSNKDKLTTTDWIRMAGEQGFGKLEKALRDFEKPSKPS
jgi:hypothetical protein